MMGRQDLSTLAKVSDPSESELQYSRKVLEQDKKSCFFTAPPLKIRFSVPVERFETTIFNPRVESRCFIPLHSYSQSDSQKSCYEKQYTLLETKHSESISCDCSPRFARAANFKLIAIAMFCPLYCNILLSVYRIIY